ncbi:MAG: SufD family Fe-S cluster assembly protein, partial [Acidimicrobiales bacterium]
MRPAIRETRDFPLTTWTPAEAAALPGPDWLRARRIEAAERVVARGLPSEAEEVWRYSRIGELDPDAYRAVPDRASAEAPALPDLVGSIGATSAVAVVDHGSLRSFERAGDPASQALEAGPPSSADADPVGPPGVDALIDLNAAFGPEALVLGVPAGVRVPHPIVVVQVVSLAGTAVFPRTVVRVGENAEATVVEILVSPDVAAWIDPVVELDLADAARLSYVGVQVLGPRVWQTAYQASRVGRDATLETTAVALGGDYARIRADSTLTGRGGTSHLGALYVGTGAQMHDVRTVQDHVAPNTTSDLLFKGAVSDVARSVYSGLIRVRK